MLYLIAKAELSGTLILNHLRTGQGCQLASALAMPVP
jgi:hypothetical protein